MAGIEGWRGLKGGRVSGLADNGMDYFPCKVSPSLTSVLGGGRALGRGHGSGGGIPPGHQGSRECAPLCCWPQGPR